jgi:hypothetical protein
VRYSHSGFASCFRRASILLVMNSDKNLVKNGKVKYTIVLHEICAVGSSSLGLLDP